MKSYYGKNIVWGDVYNESRVCEGKLIDIGNYGQIINQSMKMDEQKQGIGNRNQKNETIKYLLQFLQNMFTLLKKGSKENTRQVKLQVADDTLTFFTERHIIQTLKFGQLGTYIEWIFEQNKIIGLTIVDKNQQQSYLDGDGNLGNLYQMIAGYICYGGFRQHYQTLKSLKVRKDAEFLLCEHKILKQQYVVKAIKNYKIDKIGQLGPDEQFILKKNQYEISIYQRLKTAENNHIIQLDSIYIEKFDVYLLFDNCKGSTLFNYLSQKSSKPSIDEVITIMTQLLKGLKYIHSLGIMHRDIKLDNILLKEKNDISNLVIIDFEYAQVTQEQPYLFQKCGTPNYMAPEIVNNEQYNEKCDIYSLGVAFHILLTGSRPKENIQIENEEAADLLKHMLTEQKQRYNAEQCLNHPFLNDNHEQVITKQMQSMNFPTFKNPFN